MRKSIWTTTSLPSKDGKHPGSIIQGEYELSADNVLSVYGAGNRFIGSIKIKPGDDVVAATRRLLRTGRVGTGFNARIDYPNTKLV
jgi:hypothetical protein